MTLSAIENLFREHFRYAVLTAQSIVLSKEAAEDVVQNVFIKLLEVDLSSVKNPAAFLYTCVRHAAHDHIRSRTHSQHTLEKMRSSEEFVEVYGRESGEFPVEDIEHLQRLQHLVNAIEQLPPKMREVVKMVCLEGRSYRETAEILCVSLATVKAHMYQSFRVLREKMADVPKPKRKKIAFFSIFF